MKAHVLFEKETGKDSYDGQQLSDEFMPSKDYVTWLETFVENNHKPTIIKWIETMFQHAKNKKWFETYWCVDIHGTIAEPDYRKKFKALNFYPYAKETLQLMSKRKDIVMIMFTSSYPKEIEIYEKNFKEAGITFNYVNENPEIDSAKGSFGYYEKKPYFNVLFDDKAGFDPFTDWEFLYNYFMNTTYIPDPVWSMKYKKEHHKD